ncbi:tRNA pseudouridine synthase C [Klebsiella pneumoniae]|nr:tRNA pseudouridine synthase C [Klebsiella pneumoniae]
MLEIIYQDDWLVAVNKPSGWLVHRSWLDRDEKVVVMQTVRDQIGQHVFTAHRLDRPTSGVLLMGLSSEAGRLLAQTVRAAPDPEALPCDHPRLADGRCAAGLPAGGGAG